jgi:RNA polymerase-binding transcription factor DksA
MDAKKIEAARRRLSSEYENLIKSSIVADSPQKQSSSRTLKTKAIWPPSATIDLLHNLHEGSFARLRFIQQAMKALERGQYGECVRCGEHINEKRLEAVLWATMWIRCQEETGAEHTSSRMVRARFGSTRGGVVGSDDGRLCVN